MVEEVKHVFGMWAEATVYCFSMGQRAQSTQEVEIRTHNLINMLNSTWYPLGNETGGNKAGGDYGDRVPADVSQTK